MPGTVDLRVLVTHSNLTSGSVKFHFHPPIGVETVWPTMGSLYGGTYVYVYGINFQPTTAIRCRFGTIDTPSQFVNSSCISCVTPSQESIGTVSVEISLNGVDFTDNYVLFHYTEPPQVLFHSTTKWLNEWWDKGFYKWYEFQ